MKPQTLFLFLAIVTSWTLETIAQTGPVPNVTTDTRFARGATMAFGRMSYSGVSTNQVSEAGFCWSESPSPTIDDQRTTRHLSNNGDIYWLDQLTPATKYYMRAYVVTKGGQVGYGDAIKFYTLPKGQIQLTFRTSDDPAADARIKAAAETAIDWWNQLTEMKGFNPNIGYNPGTPTAECSYGGYMSVGSNQSYQRTGTIMHEMLHGCGVIPWNDTEWSRFNLRSGTSNGAGFTTGSGLWLGDRVTEVLRFWDNSTTSQLNGDYQHMWPYGINGAHEDNGSDVLYIGTSLICQALGEDGLQHTSSRFAEPYYAFNHEDGVKYYIKNESTERGLHTSLLVPTKTGTLKWLAMSAEEAAANDSCAWYISFTPNNQYYQLRNAATGQYLTYVSSFKTATRSTLTSFDNFQLMKGRVDVEGQRGYWIIRPGSNWTPNCLQANANGLTGSGTFDIANSATQQRWLILSAEELAAFEANSITAMKAEVTARLDPIKALLAVPHIQHQANVDQQLESTIANIEQQLTGPCTIAQLTAFIAEAQQAAFNFLSEATPQYVNRPFDLTYLMENPDMEQTEGWSGAPTVSYSCAEYYEKTFDFYQTVKNLTAGTYQMRVQAFQRPGKAEECSSRSVTAYVYAGSRSKAMAHAVSAAQATQQGGSESYVNGKYIPNNMHAASIYFGKGLYDNSVTTSVATDGGSLRLGLRSTSMDGYYWCIFDNFRLYYYGALTPKEVENGYRIGDVNEDGWVNVTDVMSVVQHVLGNTPSPFNKNAADTNADGDINVTDVMCIVNIVLGTEQE